MQPEFEACASLQGNCERRLKGFLRLSDAVLESIRDPEYGAIGAELIQKFRQTGCREHTAAGVSDTLALYVPFQGPGSPSYVDTIFYHTHFMRTEVVDQKPVAVRVERDFETLNISRIHEITHACATASAPAIHASPYNGFSPIVMSPWDWVKTHEILEGDALAKQAWLTNLLAAKNPKYEEYSKFEALSAQQFRDIRAQASSLEDALDKAADAALDAPRMGCNHPDYRTSYRSYALWQYRHMLQFLKNAGVKPVFVTLESRDFDAMVESYGPRISVMGLKNVPLTEVQQAEIKKICDDFDIGAACDLMSFGKAVQTAGYSPASFLKGSRAAPRYEIERKVCSKKPALVAVS